MSSHPSVDSAKKSSPVQKSMDAGAAGAAKAILGVGAVHGILEYLAPVAGINFYKNNKNWRLKLMLGTMAVIAKTYYDGEQAL
mmetsp:Transcript_11072/g.21203  ORF Transcript_11072/g.21203 Transcript_11072/m.21203 type:complete len:83 (-) Transcript_11072:483-731(-)